jgi:hypothetical protein
MLSVYEPHRPTDAVTVAVFLAGGLHARGQEYALGGALALGYWGIPRGTVDVDVTLFLAPERPSDCIWLLQEIGCEVPVASAAESLREHGFCRVTFSGLNVDVFLPLIPFYEVARQRRVRVQLGGLSVWVWDAETLVVFKMMFFRRKDIADVEQVLTVQGAEFDRLWVREQLLAMYGTRDPRLATWDELDREVSPS